jgi:hypothetical protein
VFVVGNTFLSLLTQEVQVRCFAAVTANLTDVIEASPPPDPSRFDRRQRPPCQYE